MTQPPVRTLAAILAADIAGYSRLMHRDEAATLADLDAMRQTVLLPAVAQARGDIVKSMGDGWLIAFASAGDAVGCAVALQTALAGHPRIALRMGLHVGDIVRTGDDLFGDGVNIAARLETLARPGAVLISDTALGLCPADRRPAFRELGPQTLKNIDAPVSVHGWAPGATEDRPLLTAAGEDPPAAWAGQPTVFIAPLETAGDRDAAGDLADDLRYELIHMFSRRTGISLTSDADTGTPPDYRLGGRCRVRSGRARLDITLSETAQGTQIWTHRFDETTDEPDRMVEQVAGVISSVFRTISTHGAGAHLADRPDGDLGVSELLAKASHLLQRYTMDGLHRARAAIDAALERDPDNAIAHAMVVSVHNLPLLMGEPMAAEFDADRVMAHADTSVSLNPNSDFAYVQRALTRCWFLKDEAGARADLARAYEINPGFHSARFTEAGVELATGRYAVAARLLEEVLPALQADPIQPICRAFCALAHLLNGDGAAARDMARDAFARGPAFRLCGLAYVMSGAAAEDGDDKAQSIIGRLGLNAAMLEVFAFHDPAETARLRGLLTAAGVPVSGG